MGLVVYCRFMKRNLRHIGVFCGSSTGNHPIYEQKAIECANEMVRRNMDLIYGGGGKGIMGSIASSMKEGKRRVIGVIPNLIYEMVRHIDHDEDELIVVETMHERKALMYDKSDAFIALPGGIGTLEEFLEVFTWLQLGYHTKPVGILNIAGFYTPFIDMLQQMVIKGFVRQEMVDALVVEEDPKTLFDRLETISLNISLKIQKS